MWRLALRSWGAGFAPFCGIWHFACGLVFCGVGIIQLSLCLCLLFGLECWLRVCGRCVRVPFGVSVLFPGDLLRVGFVVCTVGCA